MKIIIHRGTHEIGGSMVEIVSGNTRLMIDVGLPLVDEQRQRFDRRRLDGKTVEELIQEQIIPSIDGLFAPGDKVDAVLVSHCHLDHVGLLQYADPDIPVWMSTGTSKMMNAASVFGGQYRLDRQRQQNLEDRVPVQIGELKVTPFSVDHSCFGSLALLIDNGSRQVLYSGDLRFHGRKPGMLKSLIADVGPLNIDALVMEGTHLGSPRGKRQTEYELEKEIAGHISGAPGLVLATFSPIDVDRLVTYLKATMQTNRTFVVDAYAAYVMHLVKSEIPIPDPAKTDAIRVYFNEAFKRKKIEKLEQLFQSNSIELDEIRAAPSRFVMAFRPNMVQLDFGGKIPPDTRCLYSYWKGYLEEAEWQALQQQLQDIEGDFVPAHTSGHIFVDDLVQFVNSINPKTVIPIHTFEPQEFSKHFANVVVLNDGQEMEI